MWGGGGERGEGERLTWKTLLDLVARCLNYAKQMSFILYRMSFIGCKIHKT